MGHFLTNSCRVAVALAAASAASAAIAQESWSLGADFLPATSRAKLLGDFGGGGDGAAAPQDSNDEQHELAMKLQNPVADLISVPFQFNVDHGLGSTDATRMTLNIQPVVPFHLDGDWNLITRTILPVITQDELVKGAGDNHGIGDILQSFFLSPKEPVKGWIVGGGPAILWPTASDDALGNQKYGLGPTVVALRQHDGWTYGILANHIWSIPTLGDSDRRGVNSTYLQPFGSYTTKMHTSFILNTESTYDWEIDRWNVPVNVMVSQMLKVAGHPISVFGGVRTYLDSPQGGANWGIRFGVTFLFPKG